MNSSPVLGKFRNFKIAENTCVFKRIDLNIPIRSHRTCWYRNVGRIVDGADYLIDSALQILQTRFDFANTFLSKGNFFSVRVNGYNATVKFFEINGTRPYLVAVIITGVNWDFSVNDTYTLL